LASLFEIPLMEVPDFAADPNDEKWWSGVQEWLKGWGYQLLMLAVPADGQPLNFYALPASPWAIFVGPTEKGGHLHAVVGKLDGLDGSGKAADFIVEHDPLAGLGGDITVSFVGFLLPIDPRRPLKAPEPERPPENALIVPTHFQGSPLLDARGNEIQSEGIKNN
jgi:hypothetical protein